MFERVAVLERELEKAVGALERQLGGNVRPMRFHGPRADEKLRGDFFGRLL